MTTTTKAETYQPKHRTTSVLKLMADPVRTQIILRLSYGSANVGELCEAVGMHQPAVSHHLSLLRVGGLVVSRRDSKYHVYSLTETGAKLAVFMLNLQREGD